ncbi:carboxymuconolactone decarboxylase family protein [Carboxylicivirga sp. RSCT41]|uniref:carboxymuconolactone decarboxylase family protein n=1 Tax=Carboxylicivirga agarovorans TaxID=3417570 RepID=UPI003D352F68
MTKINVPTREQVDTKAQSIFDVLQKNLGMVPNLYATIAYSSDTLEAYLSYSGAIGNSSFSKKETEAIKLAVSQENECEYCTAAHTAIAKMNGFTEEETISIRSGKVADLKLNVLVNTAIETARERGRLSDETKEAFFAQGFDNKALIDLIAVVNVVSFTNFIHNATKVEVDFPAVPALNKQVA